MIRLAAGLDRRRFAPIICCMNEPGPFATQAISRGIEVIALHKRGAIDLGMLIRLTRVMRQRRPGIVHTHLWGASFWGRLAARLARVPVVIVHEHGMQPYRGAFHFFCDRWLARVTSRILFASQHVLQIYRAKTAVAESKCMVIPNGVAVLRLPDRIAARRARGWSPDDQVILSVGRLSPEKGYEDLLKAFALIASRAPHARLVLVGDGAQRAALQTLQAQSGLNGRVTFAGRQEDVTGWLAAADLYVQPSHREGLPLAVLEAMAAGVPVVATDVGDLRYVITEGRTGYLVPARQPDTLAARLVDVLEHPEQQPRIAEAARALVRTRFSDEQMIRAIERVYEDELSCWGKGQETGGGGGNR
ncbi:MAG: glycosyltransferase [Candidatus Omnitrophica bacterium]|nr:glycosyltransferase [Candidatus Omnitrophota bacterium]